MLSRKALGIFAFVLAEFYASALVIRSIGFGIAVLASIGLGFLGMNLLRRTLAKASASPFEAAVGSEGGAEGIVSSLADRALAGFGAVLLIIPGVISTIIGALLLISPARTLISPLVAGRMKSFAPPEAMAGADLFTKFSQGARRSDPTVVDVDVVETDVADSNDSTHDRPSDRPNHTADSVPPELR